MSEEKRQLNRMEIEGEVSKYIHKGVTKSGKDMCSFTVIQKQKKDDLWLRVLVYDELVESIKDIKEGDIARVVGRLTPNNYKKECKSDNCTWENYQNDKQLWADEIEIMATKKADSKPKKLDDDTLPF